jgi:hypothetical protein
LNSHKHKKVLNPKILSTTSLIIIVMLSVMLPITGIPSAKGQGPPPSGTSTAESGSGSNTASSDNASIVQFLGTSQMNASGAALSGLTAPSQQKEAEDRALLPPQAVPLVQAEQRSLQIGNLSAATTSALTETASTVVDVNLEQAVAGTNATSLSENATTSSLAGGTTPSNITLNTSGALINPQAPLITNSSEQQKQDMDVSSATGAGLSAISPAAAAIAPSTTDQQTAGEEALGATSPLTTAPLITRQQGFDGPTLAQCAGWRPPDAAMASGRAGNQNYVVVMDNLCGAIYNAANGAPLRPVFPLSTFFRVATTERLSDPVVIFDARPGNLGGRFYALLMDISRGGILVAVSPASGPINPWSVFFVSFKKPTDTQIPCPDQPFGALSQDKLVISANVFSNQCNNPQYLGTQIVFINKAGLLGLTPIATQSPSRDPNAFSLHPVLSNTPDQRIVLVSDRFGLNERAIRMEVWSGPLTPAIHGVFRIGLFSVPIRPTTLPPHTVAQGVVTNDGRTLSAVDTAKGNFLWLTFNEGCRPPSDPVVRSCTRLIEINKAARLPRQDFDIAATKGNTFYAALTTGLPQDSLFVVFGGSSATIFPSLFATKQRNIAPIQTLDPAILLRAGSASAASQGRYGDYFSASPDPANPTCAWLYGEYMKAATNWGTWANRVC